jgi:uncharacterized OB-fold protein
MIPTKNKIPVREGLWTDASSEGDVRLLASKCKQCGEIFFPKKNGGVCTHCQHDTFIEMKLSSTGKIYSYSVVMIRPPEYYKGDVPYALGFVDLPEGIKVETLFTQCDFDELAVDMEVEMILDTLYIDDEGNEVICYKFRPVKT